jgi:hypothetical protein
MNLPKNKHLVIFDFDETLCSSFGLVRRKNYKTAVEDLLTPGEYSEWRESGEYDSDPTNWDLNFSDFTGYPEKGKAIIDTLCRLREYLKDDSYISAIVTGRDELAGPKKWLEKHSIRTEKLILMCSGDPNKRPCYESLINTFLPAVVTIYEDCTVYIEQCEEVCAKYEIPCASVLVDTSTICWGWRSLQPKKEGKDEKS